MISIGVIDTDSYEKLLRAIRAVYGLKSGISSGYRHDFSAEFSEEIFYSKGCPSPYVTDLTKRVSRLIRPNVLIVNKIPKDKKFELQKDYRLALVNTDDIDLTKNLRIRKTGIITYGFNSRASVTVSSVSDNGLTVCVQRAIPTISGAKIEQQEFNMRLDLTRVDNISHMLAAVTAGLIDD
jgi:hypothetical protein